MKSADLKAVSLSSEININKIAQHFGINKKLKWEEPLFLDENFLEGILRAPQGKSSFIFNFGAIVFVNLTHHEIMDIINYLKKLEKSINTNPHFEFVDEFTLNEVVNTELTIDYESMTVPEIKEYDLEILATILAKSVSLEKIEAGIEILIDEIEDIVELLDKGHLNITEKQMSKIWSRVLRFRYNTISYIMLLDKPDFTWENEEASMVFNKLTDFFELKERYKNIQLKTQTLSDIVEAFESLTNSRRSTNLEWLIIILIAFEIVLTLLEKIFGI